MDKYKLKKFALEHPVLLKLFRNTFGRLKTGLYWNIQKKALQKNGIKTIQKIVDELEKEGARIFIDFGTLLGITRDKKLIKYDKDIDFGIYFDDIFSSEDLDRVMKRLGLKKFRSFLYNNELAEVTYTSGVTHIDFFRHQEIGEESIVYAFYRNPDYEYPSKNCFTPLQMHHAHIPDLKRIKVGNLKVNIPVNTEEYLESAYTKDWRIPDPHWTYLRDPGLHEIKDAYGILQK